MCVGIEYGQMILGDGAQSSAVARSSEHRAPRPTLNVTEFKEFAHRRGTYVGGLCSVRTRRNPHMNSVIYLIGLIVVVLAVLSFLGFH